MSVTKQEFDRIHEAGKALKVILLRDRVQYEPGIEDYLVCSVEEATRLTKRALDVDCTHAYTHDTQPADYKFCPWCGGQHRQRQ
jgi:hypothetical protein